MNDVTYGNTDQTVEYDIKDTADNSSPVRAARKRIQNLKMLRRMVQLQVQKTINTRNLRVRVAKRRKKDAMAAASRKRNR